jgi:hypothetical protein
VERGKLEFLFKMEQKNITCVSVCLKNLLEKFAMSFSFNRKESTGTGGKATRRDKIFCRGCTI